MKSRIIEHLGEAGVLLPSLVADGLAANDRVKVHLSTLQAAADHARNQGDPTPDLTAECRAAGIDPVPVSRLISEAKISADGRVTAPHLPELGKSILAEIGAMLRAVDAGSPSEGKRTAECLARTKVQERLGSLSDISQSDIAELTGISRANVDNLHRLIMGLHKVLNRLAADSAEEMVSGAHAYGLKADDRAPVEAFMRGVKSTSHLKFDHPASRPRPLGLDRG